MFPFVCRCSIDVQYFCCFKSIKFHEYSYVVLLLIFSNSGLLEFSILVSVVVFKWQSYFFSAISPEQMSAMSLAPKRWNDVETYCKVQLESHDY